MVMKYVVIPEWVEQAFKTAGLPLSGLLDAKTLTTTLSKHDVAFYLLSQRILHKIFPSIPGGGDKDIIASETPKENDNGLEPFSYWRLSDETKIELPYNLMENIETAIGEIQPKHMLGLINQQTVNDNAATPHGHSATDWVFSCVVLENNVIGIHPVLADKTQNYEEQLIESYGKLIHLMCQYLPFEAVASTTIFTTFTYQLYLQEYQNIKAA